MTHGIDESELHAYLDEELDLEGRQRVEAALRDDPALRARDAALRQADVALRDALRPALEGPMPELRLPVVVAARPERRFPSLLGRRARAHACAVGSRARGAGSLGTQSRWWSQPAQAASLAFIGGAVIGAAVLAAIGYPQAPPAAALHAEHLLNALESQPSGSTVSWRNPDGAQAGEVTPVRTYKTDTGEYCREFDERRTRAAATTVSHGVACREHGSWRVRVRVYP